MLIVTFLADSYWAKDTSRTLIARSIDEAMSFGLYAPDGAQIGYARVVTDYARFAWLSDVFNLPTHRGRGLGVWLVETIVDHAPFKSVSRFVLATRDAHGVYRKSGFVPLDSPDIWMLRKGA